MNKQTDLVPCPACDGQGYQEVEYSNSFFRIAGRFKKLQRPCFSCLKQGKVEASRVCQGCGKFISGCLCTIVWRNVTVEQLKVVEVWKDVPGYEGVYQVSNLGRVK